MVMAMWFPVFSVEAVVRLRNFVVMINKNGFNMERTQYSDFGNLVLVALTLSDTQGPLWY